ncbi:hypothetical protein PENDEC_c021G04167 [Penicillium decumbens]|uniref:Invertebrate defensins family profile domain-containing protein n=1 Tax=Penicillium decumbens TaxID=69771 RepID=A0A1V6P774_PENDC|nr:hypothetical protein PENDEC_c021G04167 [Penicillium decumbens]
MYISLVSILTFVGVALAATSPLLDVGAACNKDGSMGNCASGFCMQLPSQQTGKCQ